MTREPDGIATRILFACLLLFNFAFAQNKNSLWDTESDFRKYEPAILEHIGKFHEDPNGPEVAKLRRIVKAWAVEAPHIGFTRPGKYLAEIGKGHVHSPVLMDAYTFGEIELKLRGKREFQEDLAKRMADSIKPKVDVVLLFSRVNSGGQIKEFFDHTRAPYAGYHDFDAGFSKEYGGGLVPVLMLVRKDGSALRATGNEERLREVFTALEGL